MRHMNHPDPDSELLLAIQDLKIRHRDKEKKKVTLVFLGYCNKILKLINKKKKLFLKIMEAQSPPSEFSIIRWQPTPGFIIKETVRRHWNCMPWAQCLPSVQDVMGPIPSTRNGLPLYHPLHPKDPMSSLLTTPLNVQHVCFRPNKTMAHCRKIQFDLPFISVT